MRILDTAAACYWHAFCMFSAYILGVWFCYQFSYLVLPAPYFFFYGLFLAFIWGRLLNNIFEMDLALNRELYAREQWIKANESKRTNESD